MKTPMHLPIRFLHKDKENTAMSFENTQYARDYFQEINTEYDNKLLEIKTEQLTMCLK